MREIKFRAYNPEFMIMSENFLLTDILKGLSEGCNFDGSILMQYTGLKDKNGKEIYEGDIVQYLYTGDDNEIKNDEVIFSNGVFKIKASSFQTPCLYQSPKEFKIIGNIYENPELLVKHEG